MFLFENGLPPKTLDTVGWASLLRISPGLRVWSKAEPGIQAVDSNTACNGPEQARLKYDFRQ